MGKREFREYRSRTLLKGVSEFISPAFHIS